MRRACVPADQPHQRWLRPEPYQRVLLLRCGHRWRAAGVHRRSDKHTVGRACDLPLRPPRRSGAEGAACLPHDGHAQHVVRVLRRRPALAARSALPASMVCRAQGGRGRAMGSALLLQHRNCHRASVPPYAGTSRVATRLRASPLMSSSTPRTQSTGATSLRICTCAAALRRTTRTS